MTHFWNNPHHVHSKSKIGKSFPLPFKCLGSVTTNVLWKLIIISVTCSLFQMEEKSLGTPVLLLFFDGIFSMLQNVFAFTVLAMVTTLSYAVANATKRVVIIGASLVFLQNPVTIANFIGMMIAIFGVLVYNKVRESSFIVFRRGEYYSHFIFSSSNFIFKGGGKNINLDLSREKHVTVIYSILATFDSIFKHMQNMFL